MTIWGHSFKLNAYLNVNMATITILTGLGKMHKGHEEHKGN